MVVGLLMGPKVGADAKKALGEIPVLSAIFREMEAVAPLGSRHVVAVETDGTEPTVREDLTPYLDMEPPGPVRSRPQSHWLRRQQQGHQMFPARRGARRPAGVA